MTRLIQKGKACVGNFIEFMSESAVRWSQTTKYENSATPENIPDNGIDYFKIVESWATHQDLCIIK